MVDKVQLHAELKWQEKIVKEKGVGGDTMK